MTQRFIAKLRQDNPHLNHCHRRWAESDAPHIETLTSTAVTLSAGYKEGDKNYPLRGAGGGGSERRDIVRGHDVGRAVHVSQFVTDCQQRLARRRARQRYAYWSEPSQRATINWVTDLREVTKSNVYKMSGVGERVGNRNETLTH